MPHIARLLFVMDDVPGDMKNLKQALDIEKERESVVRVLCVMESLPRADRMLVTALTTGELKERVVARRRQQLQELISTITPKGVDLQVKVRFGSRAKEIVREAAEGDYDLVIKHPEHGRTDPYLSRHCSCPVQLLNASGSLTHGSNPKRPGLLQRLLDRRAGCVADTRSGAGSFAG
jgi:nucleotide-binding universal stress UspA family protein